MMAVDSSWDINDYHNKFEPNEHWELKREFLLAHKKNIAEDKLASLAQVYVNMELLGCRYPTPVSNQVRELSKGLGANYRDSRQNKLQKTFVKASDAVLAKLRKEDPAITKQRNTAATNSEETTSKDIKESQASSVSKFISNEIGSVMIQEETTLTSEKADNTEIVCDLETSNQILGKCSKSSDQQTTTFGPFKVADLMNTTNAELRKADTNLGDINTTCGSSSPADPINTCGPSIPADPINTCGPSRPADPINTCDPSRLADPINTCDLSRPADPINTCDLSRPADPINTCDPSRPADPINTCYLSRPADPINTCDPSRPADPINTCDPSRPADPINTCGPSRPANPINTCGPSRPADPITTCDPSRPADPINTCDPSRPADLINACGPCRPAEPINTCDLSRPADTINTCGPSRPADPINTCDLSRPADPINTCDLFRPADPINTCGPSRPADLINTCGPCRPAEPINTCDLSRPADPINTCGPSRPADPINTCDPSRPADPINTCDPSRPADLINACGPCRPAEPINTCDPSRPAEPINTCDLSRPADLINTCDPSRPADIINTCCPSRPAEPINTCDLSRPANTINTCGPSRPADPINTCDPSRPADPINTCDPYRPADPINTCYPSRPADIINTCGPSRPADPINTCGPSRPADPINTCDPSRPADPINTCYPSRPADIINTCGPSRPANTINTCGPSRPAEPIKPSSEVSEQTDPINTCRPSTDDLDAIIKVWNSTDPLAKLILINRSYIKYATPSLILNHSFEACAMSYSVDFNPQHKTYVASVNKTPVESVPLYVGLEAANDQLALTVLDSLCQRCCMLEIKKEPGINSRLIQLDDIEGSQRAAQEDKGLLKSFPPITNDNVGYKMLKMMGWSEGGLGKDGSGRTAPVEAGMMWGRKGLGYTDLSGGLVTAEFKEKTTTLIRNFIRDVEDMVSESEEFLFSSNLSEEQLRFIHSTARQLMLRSNSYREVTGRNVVLKLELSVHQRLLRASKQGSSNDDNFAVYLPGTYSIDIFNLTSKEIQSLNDLRSLKIEGGQSAASYSACQGKPMGRLTTRKAGRIYANSGPPKQAYPIDSTSGPSTQPGDKRKPEQASNSHVANYKCQKKVHLPFSAPTYEQSCQGGGMNHVNLDPYPLASNRTTMDLSNTQKLNAIMNIWGGNDPLSKLILINLTYSQYSTPHYILTYSFKSCGMMYTVSSNAREQTFVAYVNKAPFQWVPSFLGKEAAKEQLAIAVLENLCHRCCLLEVKKKHCQLSQQIQTDDMDGSRGKANEGASDPFTNDNIGNKMLKTMGWTEGGLGKDGNGRVDPIEPSMMCGREGLGFTGSSGGGLITPEFKETTMKLIRNFSKDVDNGLSETGELHFSPKFSKEQREFIHTTARQLKLKSRSFGKDGERFLVLSMKLSVHQKLLQALRHGSYNDKFEVHLPGTYNPSIFNFVCR